MTCTRLPFFAMIQENGGQRYAFPPPIPLVNKHVDKSALEWGVPLLSI